MPDLSAISRRRRSDLMPCSNRVDVRFKKSDPGFLEKKQRNPEEPLETWEDPGGPGVALEPDQETADDPLGGADDEQFVVDRGWIVWIVEQVADADQHLPLRVPESERKRLVDLQI